MVNLDLILIDCEEVLHFRSGCRITASPSSLSDFIESDSLKFIRVIS